MTVSNLSFFAVGFVLGMVMGIFMLKRYYANLKAVARESLSQEDMQILEFTEAVQEKALEFYKWAERLPKKEKQ